MPPGGWAARDLVTADIDRRRVGVRWVRPVGARPRSVAAYLRVREACESERARKESIPVLHNALPDRQQGSVADDGREHA